jgi:hypothetical protein
MRMLRDMFPCIGQSRLWILKHKKQDQGMTSYHILSKSSHSVNFNSFPNFRSRSFHLFICFMLAFLSMHCDFIYSGNFTNFTGRLPETKNSFCFHLPWPQTTFEYD